MSSVGSKIRSLREERRMSLRELAARAGITHRGLTKIEDGRADPRLGTVKALAEALDVPIEDLIRPRAIPRGRTRR